MSRYLYATALLAVLGAFAAWMTAVLTGEGTTAAVGTILFGFGLTMTGAAAIAEYRAEP